VDERVNSYGKEGLPAREGDEKVGDTIGTSATEVAYENTADEAWASLALDFYQRRQLQVQAFNTEGVVSAQVWGTCPRCGHELNAQPILSTPIVGVRDGRGLWASLTRRDSPEAPRVLETIEVGCGCGRTHPGAPDQVTGCGVSFRLPTALPDPPARP
jgi:hypothetical protein